MKIKIAIVEDNKFLIEALKEKLSFYDDLVVKFSVSNGSELLLELDKNHNLDLILMDIEMPEINGIEATQKVKDRFPHIKIIMFTVFDNDENIFRSIKAGADGYLLKEVNPKDLYQGIIETINGGATMTPSIAMKTLKLFRNPTCFEEVLNTEEYNLSSREIEVLEQLSKGLKYTIIAQNLFLSPSTVRKHIENIYSKLQVHSKLEAVQKARNNNLI